MSHRKLQRTRPLVRPSETSPLTSEQGKTSLPINEAELRAPSTGRATSAQAACSTQATSRSTSQRPAFSANPKNATKPKPSSKSSVGSAKERTSTRSAKDPPIDIANRPAFNLDLGGPPPSNHSRTGLRAPMKSSNSVNVHVYTTKERAELFARSRASQPKKATQPRSNTAKRAPSIENAYKVKDRTNMAPGVNTSMSEHSFNGRSSSNISYSNPFRSHSEQARSALSTSDLTSSSGSSARNVRSTYKFKDMSMENRGMQVAVNAVTDIAYRSGTDLTIFGDSSFGNYSTASKLKKAKTKEEQNKIRQHQVSELIGDMAHYQARIASPAEIRSPFLNFGTTKQTAAIKATSDALEKIINPPKPKHVTTTSKQSEQRQVPLKCAHCGMFLGVVTEAADQKKVYCAHCAGKMRTKADEEKIQPQYRMLVSPSTINRHTTAVSPSIVETMVVTQGRTPPHPEPQTTLPSVPSPPIYSVQNVPRKMSTKQTKIYAANSDIPLITDVIDQHKQVYQNPPVEKWDPTDTIQHIPRQDRHVVIQTLDREDPLQRKTEDPPADLCNIIPAIPTEQGRLLSTDGNESVTANAKPIMRSAENPTIMNQILTQRYTPDRLAHLSDDEIENLIVQRISDLHKSIHDHASSARSLVCEDRSSSEESLYYSSSDENEASRHKRHSKKGHHKQHKSHKHHSHHGGQRLAYKDGKQVIIEKVKCPCCDDVIEMRILDDEGQSSAKHKHKHESGGERRNRSEHHRHHRYNVPETNNMQACLALLGKQILEARAKSSGRLGQFIAGPSQENAIDEERRKDRLALLQRLDDRLANIQAMSGALSLGARCSSLGNPQLHSAYGVLNPDRENTHQVIDSTEVAAAPCVTKTSSATAYGLDDLFELHVPETCRVGY